MDGVVPVVVVWASIAEFLKRVLADANRVVTGKEESMRAEGNDD